MTHLRSRRPRTLAPLALACVGACGAARADLAALERVPLPRGAAIELVAVDLVQNGSPVSIATFEAARGVDEVLGFYRAAWPEAVDGVPGHVEAELGEWRIVSRFENGTNVALQLRTGERGRATGLLSAQSVEGAGVAESPPPVPPGAELLSTTRTRDGDRTVRTHVVSSVARPGQLVAFYEDAFERAGWSLDAADRPGGVLRVSRRGARAELVATRVPDGTTVAILNEITGEG